MCLNVYVCDRFVYHVAGSKLAQCNRDGMELLRPFIAARLGEKRESENFVRRFLFIPLEDSPSEQNDYLTWLIQKSKGEDVKDSPVAARMFALNFVAIQTSSMVSFPNHQVDTNPSPIQAIIHALLDLVSNPEYLEPLREEVEEVTKREGWTKTALDQMCKIDSFLKESQRLNPSGVCELLQV